MSKCERCKHYDESECNDCYMWDYKKGIIMGRLAPRKEAKND